MECFKEKKKKQIYCDKCGAFLLSKLALLNHNATWHKLSNATNDIENEEVSPYFLGEMDQVHETTEKKSRRTSALTFLLKKRQKK